MKKKIFVSVCILLVILSINAFAWTDSYESTLYLSPNSTCQGSKRTYTGTVYHTTIDEVTVNSSWTNCQMTVSVNSSNIFGITTEYCSKKITVENGHNSSEQIGGAGKGTRYYVFSTHGDDGYGGLVSDATYMQTTD
jgi:hypothetical protein